METEPKKTLSKEALQVLSMAFDKHTKPIRAIADENGGQVLIKGEQIYPSLESSPPSKQADL